MEINRACNYMLHVIRFQNGQRGNDDQLDENITEQQSMGDHINSLTHEEFSTQQRLRILSQQEIGNMIFFTLIVIAVVFFIASIMYMFGPLFSVSH